VYSFLFKRTIFLEKVGNIIYNNYVKLSYQTFLRLKKSQEELIMKVTLITQMDRAYVGSEFNHRFGTVNLDNLGMVPMAGTDKYFVDSREITPIGYDEWGRPIFTRVVEDDEVVVKFILDDSKVDVDSTKAVKEALQSVEKLEEFFYWRKIYIRFYKKKLKKYIAYDSLYIDYDTVYFLRQDLVKTRKGGIVDADYWGNIIWGQLEINCPMTLEEEVAFRYIEKQKKKKEELKRILKAFDSFE
jgi:hypothetical protein